LNTLAGVLSRVPGGRVLTFDGRLRRREAGRRFPGLVGHFVYSRPPIMAPRWASVQQDLE